MQSVLYEAYRESTEATKKIFILLLIIFPVPLFILIPHPHRASMRVSQCQNKMRSRKIV